MDRLPPPDSTQSAVNNVKYAGISGQDWQVKQTRASGLVQFSNSVTNCGSRYALCIQGGMFDDSSSGVGHELMSGPLNTSYRSMDIVFICKILLIITLRPDRDLLQIAIMNKKWSNKPSISLLDHFLANCTYLLRQMTMKLTT